jgi:eukaryotic-like serine/threonine-protein kinase
MPRVLAGRYALEDEIAVGGFARVYRATDRRLNRPVAVKMLDAGRVATADPAAKQRFVREARSSAGFTHPHAVTVYDAGEADGELFIVMELVDGPSLAEAMADRGQFAESDAVLIATQVLSALGAAHASGIVHRDVKPANILLDARGDAKLADFGIAKRFDDLTDSLTATGLIVGTPRYLSPEYARGEPISPATDIYAVGVILHEMLAGAPPFADESLLATANRDRHPVPRVGDIRSGITPSVADATARALAPDPADRFSSADAMAEALGGGSSLPTEAASTAGAKPVVTPTVAASSTGIATRIAPVAATEVMPHPPGATRRPRALAIFLVLCVIGILAIVLALRDEPSGTDLVSATDTSAAASAADIALTAPATPATDTTAAAVATVAPTTVAPTTPPTAPAVDELIPGFPVPPDLDTFLAQLEGDPSKIGQHGVEVERELERILGERSDRKRGERARELIAHAEDWAEEGNLDATVADHLIDLLAPIAGDGNGNGNGDDDD